MPHAFGPEHEQLREMLRDFGRRELLPGAPERDMIARILAKTRDEAGNVV